MLKWRWFLAVFAAAMFIGPDSDGAQNSQDAEIRLIRATFAGYIKMLKERKGSAAANYVDQNTLAYYARMHHLALHGTERQVRALPLMGRIIVLRTRHQVPLAQLQKMNRAQFFAHGVKMDWMDSARASTLSPGIVEVNGRRATVYILQNGKPTPITFTFRKESGWEWRIDLTSFFALGNAALKTVISKDQTEDQFIFDLLKTVSGRQPSPDIWKPLIPPDR